MRRVCEFIDLPFDPQMLKYYERAGDIVSTTAVPDRHKDIFLPPTKGLKDWRRDLSDDPGGPLRSPGRWAAHRDRAMSGSSRRCRLSARNAALRQVAADSARYAVRKVKKVVR